MPKDLKSWALVTITLVVAWLSMLWLARLTLNEERHMCRMLLIVFISSSSVAGLQRYSKEASATYLFVLHVRHYRIFIM